MDILAVHGMRQIYVIFTDNEIHFAFVWDVCDSSDATGVTDCAL
jgi:hypothetical protein